MNPGSGENPRGSFALSILSPAGNPANINPANIRKRARKGYTPRVVMQNRRPANADRLLRFLMNGMLLAERAVFVEFDSVRIVFLILIIVVISLLTFGASQSDSGSTSFWVIFRLLKKFTPHMRSAN